MKNTLASILVLLSCLGQAACADSDKYSQDPNQPWPPKVVGPPILVNPLFFTDPNPTNALA